MNYTAMQNEFNKYPTILLDFKGTAPCDNFDDFFKKFKG